MKKLLLFVMAFFCVATISAQDALIPLDYKTTDPANYYKYEQNALNCANWLINMPLGEREFERDIVMDFFITWLMESPTVWFDSTPEIIEFTDKSNDLFVIFSCGYTSYMLNLKKEEGTLNTNSTPKGLTREEFVDGNVAALECCLEFYKNNKAVLGRNSHLENFKKKQKEGTLRAFVEAAVPM